MTLPVSGGIDGLREVASVRVFIKALMSAGADTVCRDEDGTRSEERSSSRSSYQHRHFDTAP